MFRSTYAIEPPDAAEVRRCVIKVDIEAKFAEDVKMVDSCEASPDYYNIIVLGHVDDLELMAVGMKC